ncbi:MAG: hypothetical protein QNJ94_10350 [Alphaproteobacteria bacterium]|nr:hypothetical protein [Alphaproteobacteria bacterium]
MQFLLNSRLRPGVTREQFIEHIRDNRDDQVWDLVRTGIIQHWLWKVGDAPGIVLLINCENAEEARTLAESAPIVKRGIVEFDVDPIDPFPAPLLSS